MVLIAMYLFPLIIYLFISTVVLQLCFAPMRALTNSVFVRLHKAIWLAKVEGHHKAML